MEPKLKPPANTIRIMRVADLPQHRDPAHYEIFNEDGKRHVETLDKRKRQVMDLLMRGPVFCASPVRLSDAVFILKHDNGVEVETTFYPGDPATGIGAYGVYMLVSQVRRLGESEVAA